MHAIPRAHHAGQPPPSVTRRVLREFAALHHELTEVAGVNVNLFQHRCTPPPPFLMLCTTGVMWALPGATGIGALASAQRSWQPASPSAELHGPRAAPCHAALALMHTARALPMP